MAHAGSSTSLMARVGQASTAVRMASTGSPSGSVTQALAWSSWAKVPGAYTMHIPLPMHRSRSTDTSRTGGNRRLGRAEAVEPLGVAPQDLVLHPGGKVAYLLPDDVDAVGPGGVRVRVVGLAHDV